MYRQSRTSFTNTQHQPRRLPRINISDGENVNLDRLRQMSQEHITSHGFDYFSYTGYFPIVEDSHQISTFPEHWSLLTQDDQFAIIDPIALYSKSRTKPFSWKEVHPESVEGNENLKKMLTVAKHNNIHGGFCFPIHGAGAEWGMFNVARRSTCTTLCVDIIESLQVFTLALHEAVKRAKADGLKERAQKRTLSPRERECLVWIAAGKTAWETAKIVGITESTVAYHIRNTINKLNASNRSHAVAVALARSLISNPNSRSHRNPL